MNFCLLVIALLDSSSFAFSRSKITTVEECTQAVLGQETNSASTPDHLGFQELPSAISYELPESFKKLIQSNSIRSLKNRYGDGQSIVFSISNYPENESDLTSVYLGEKIQASFIAKVLKVIFPQAKFEASHDNFSYQDGARRYEEWLKLNPGKHRIHIAVNDPAEHLPGSKYKTDLATVTMPIAKSANPGIGELERDSLRNLLGIQPTDQVLSLYFKHPDGRKDDIKHVPTVSAALAKIERKYKPNLVFVSAGGSTIDELNSNYLKLKKTYSIHSLSEFGNIKRDPRKRYLFINDLLGKLPSINQISDLAIVSGPINILESITEGTKTLFFDNPEVTKGYDPQTFQKMAKIAVATGGGFPVSQLSELARATQLAFDSNIKITPAYEVKDPSSGGRSALEEFLAQLQSAIDHAELLTQQLIKNIESSDISPGN